MDLGLKGKIALLTGASSGLGFATAKTLAAEGVRLAINSRNPEHLERAKAELTALGAEVLTLPADVSDPATPQKLIDATVSAYGGLDLLFTNSGGPHQCVLRMWMTQPGNPPWNWPFSATCA